MSLASMSFVTARSATFDVGHRKTIGLLLWFTMLTAADARGAEPAANSDSAPPLRVAIYDDVGGGGVGPTNCERCLPQGAGFATRRISAEEIRDGALERFDVLIVPGGSGSKQAGELQTEGRDAIRRFVDGGGGYVGICAGAYLATVDYSWSLNLLDAKVLDRKHWARGTGDVEIRLSPAAQQLLGDRRERVTVFYGQGPLLAPAANDAVPDFESLATYETEIAKNGAPVGVMKGTVAAARGTFGKGRVFCYSPHPEKTAGLDRFLEQAVRWTGASDAGAPAR